MQISLNIQDDVYQKLISAGVDMQSKINDYLVNLAEKRDTYPNSKQFQEDKAYFNDALDEIENGNTKLLNQKEYDDKMNEFMQAL
jgi:hypothetical protein